MAKDKGASHRVIAKRPPGPQHVRAAPTKQPKLIATTPVRRGKTFISGEA